MAIYDLTGSGVQGLTSGTAQLLVDVTSFDVHRSVGRATPGNYFDLGLLRIGQQGSYRPTVPVDASSMVLDLPDRTDVLGYSLFGTTAIRVTEVAAAALGNPTRILRTYNASIPAGSSGITLWTYTVPTARVLRVGLLTGALSMGAAAGGSVQIQAAGANIMFITPPTTNTQGSFVQEFAPVPFYLLAGDVVAAFGSASGGSGAQAFATLLGVEFDAATWVPSSA